MAFVLSDTKKREQIKPKVTRRKYIIKIRGTKSMKWREKKNSWEKSMKPNWFFGKINKIDKPLPVWLRGKKRRHKLPVTEMSDVIDSTD